MVSVNGSCRIKYDCCETRQRQDCTEIVRVVCVVVSLWMWVDARV